MANVKGAYCEQGDLLIGDIPLAQRHGDGTPMIKSAANEIDGQIGHIYVTPITVESRPEYRPTVLLLRKINYLIASGRLLLDMAAAAEDQQTHSYGMSLLREGINLLGSVSSGKIELIGVDKHEEVVNTGAPRIIHEDPESLVEAFYTSTPFGVNRADQVRPYGYPRVN